jgi:serralysin
MYPGTDSVNITVSSDNWFLVGGPGDDAIQAFGGYNVLDGGTGSNFLSGGSGTDTFFVNDINPSANVWSTVNNFHGDDDVTVFGVDPGKDILKWVDNQGASGYTGLTLHASSPNGPTASLTLVGYNTADLSNGTLNVQFGNEADGTPFMHIVGT